MLLYNKINATNSPLCQFTGLWLPERPYLKTLQPDSTTLKNSVSWYETNVQSNIHGMCGWKWTELAQIRNNYRFLKELVITSKILCSVPGKLSAFLSNRNQNRQKTYKYSILSRKYGHYFCIHLDRSWS